MLCTSAGIKFSRLVEVEASNTRHYLTMASSVPHCFIQAPTDTDILCGKSKQCHTSPGSQRYRLIIDSYRHRYANALTRHDKMEITMEICELFRKTNSRFLKYNTSEKAWKEIPFLIARDKIGHALRFQNRKRACEGHKTLDTKNEAHRGHIHDTTTAAATSTPLQSPSDSSTAAFNKNGSAVARNSGARWQQELNSFAYQYMRKRHGSSFLKPSDMSTPLMQDATVQLLCSATSDRYSATASGSLEPTPFTEYPRDMPQLTVAVPTKKVIGTNVGIGPPVQTGPFPTQNPSRGVIPTELQFIPTELQFIDTSGSFSAENGHAKPDESSSSSSSSSVGSSSGDSACWPIMQDPAKDWALTEI